ncbi:hypothetical protein [Collimonas fungivorans]|nr:hypothetical protein [Collimonas fungivorans]
MKRIFTCALIFLFVAVSAQAATAGYSGYTGAASIVNGVPGKVATASLGAVVDATVLDQVVVATEAGARVTVPVSTTAAVAAEGIAGAGLKLVPYLGAALTAAQVASMLKNAGLRYGSCSAQSWFGLPAYCQQPPAADQYLWHGGFGSNSSVPYPDPTSACQGDMAALIRSNSTWAGWTMTLGSSSGPDVVGCVLVSPTGVVGSSNFTVASRYLNPNPGQLPPLAPATGDDIAGALKLQAIQDSNARKALYDAIKSDLAAHPEYQTADTNPVQPSTPASVTASPVISPTVTTRVDTVPKSDGSTDTVTTSQSTTVNPTTTGTTVGDIKTTFPSTTTTTVTTTNNVTNQTTTNTSVTSNPAPSPELKIPDDYNKEVTQKQVEKDLNTDAAPPMDDQQKVITDANTKGDTDRDKIYDDIKSGQQDKSSWFSWVWSPPVGVCAPITGVIAGFHVSWDLCPSIAIIQAIIGWLMGIFSAAEVYGQLFKRED